MTDDNAKEPKRAAITSPDMNAERLQELKRLFPDLFNGEGQLDEDALRALASPQENSGMERFCFEWPGKYESKRRAFTPSRATLVEDKKRSHGKFEDTQNVIIEGDNLEALKLLRTTYFEKVKCIYIDPPYNTTSDFIYPDNYTEGKKAYWRKNGTIKDGVKLIANPETSGRRHSNWLNMMQPRLLLARQLLREDGVIFISIDDNEVHHLRKLCDEIFGEENFISKFLWKKKSTTSNVGEAQVSPQVDYQLCYRKREQNVIKPRIKPSSERRYPHTDDIGVYRDTVIEKKDSGLYKRDTMKYPIIGHRPRSGKRWQIGEDLARELESKNRFFWDGEKVKLKIYDFEDKDTLSAQPNLLDKHGSTESGSDDVNNQLFNIPELFDNPKPTELISHFINVSTTKDTENIFMDFFAGSGTAAHAVMQQNAEDGGNRKYILVQVPEYTDEKSEAYKAGYKTISDICIERVKRAGDKIKAENPDAVIDTGFRVYRLSDSHFAENLFISDPEKSEAENKAALQEHLKLSDAGRLFPADNLSDVITELSLKNGYGLFFTLEPLKELFPKNTVYRLCGNDKSTLLCLDDTIRQETLDTLIENHADDRLIIAKAGLDTAAMWTLQQAFKDNMQIV